MRLLKSQRRYNHLLLWSSCFQKLTKDEHNQFIGSFKNYPFDRSELEKILPNLDDVMKYRNLRRMLFWLGFTCFVEVGSIIFNLILNHNPLSFWILTIVLSVIQAKCSYGWYRSVKESYEYE